MVGFIIIVGEVFDDVRMAVTIGVWVYPASHCFC